MLADLLDGCIVEVPEEKVAETGKHLCLDKGYDYKCCHEAAKERGFVVHIQPKPGKEQPSSAQSEASALEPDGAQGQDTTSEEAPPSAEADGNPQAEPRKARRWVVEVCHSWLNRFRRILIRWEKKLGNYVAFVQLAICLLIYRKLRRKIASTLSG